MHLVGVDRGHGGSGSKHCADCKTGEPFVSNFHPSLLMRRIPAFPVVIPGPPHCLRVEPDCVCGVANANAAGGAQRKRQWMARVYPVLEPPSQTHWFRIAASRRPE